MTDRSRSPFSLLANAASFAKLARELSGGAGGPSGHVVLGGLLGASRSLLAGALGLHADGRESGTGCCVVLLVVDGPESALDAVADLRAFSALQDGPASVPAGRDAGPTQLEQRDEDWTDPTDRHGGRSHPSNPAGASLPQELRGGSGEIEGALFPAWDVLPTESDRPEGLTLAGRRRVTDRLREIRTVGMVGPAPVPAGRDAGPTSCYLIAAPLAALMQPCEAPSDTGNTIELRAGGEQDPILLGRKLMDAGYDRVGQVEVRGEFALRGGILDIFPYTSDTPFRLDFFGETIESIKPFDPLSQRSGEPVPGIGFADASPQALKRLFSPGASGGKGGPYSLLDHLPAGAPIVFQEPGKLRQRAELYSASLVSGRSIFFALDALLEQCKARGGTLQLVGGWADLPAGPTQLGWPASPNRTAGVPPVLTDDRRDAGGTGVTEGRRDAELVPLAQPAGSLAGLASANAGDARSGQADPSSAAGTGKLPRNSPRERASGTSSLGREEIFAILGGVQAAPAACTTLQRVQGDIATNAEAWKTLAAEREQVLVMCETAGHRQRLQALFEAAQVPLAGTRPFADRTAGVSPVLGAHNRRDAGATGIALCLGTLSGGFDLRECGLAMISDREILGIHKHAIAGPAAKERKKKRVPGSAAIQHLMDLQLGDYVVHAAHGIARYLGLARLEKSGRTEDYLALLFANDVKLYVPAAHIGWVGKYIGGHADLQLSTLGGKIWARKKARAAAAIRDIAEDLLRVQAVRRSLPGIVYPPDQEWQQPFEDGFPYEETPDQVTAVQAVKKDMEGTCPMDRLLCGDVGFGKTEVALRAAFKAASSGKQVAVLAPTTLLAEQHGRTFKERFAGYPLAVEVLSRFKTPAEQKRIIERLATGRIDVVIGTHRLIQKDVRFKDLGLAIVDEEQRFGVEHKEFFKQLRKSLDVLTMTATPIPRTLHMSLLGLRDISNLTTPPRNRRPITTKVARVSDDLLRRAILREISRGGQVFVVHPRVHDIEDFRDSLAALVPEARFAVGHGQMHADELEEVMAEFLAANVDVLVSTTIVESGLDIPTANTILIHEADRFGLAELHQLRGRVGRSDLQAYCYLLLPEHSALTPEAQRRLRALEEFDELGAGFQLALRDLEIRGAGNVLGRQQSGEIAEVGYDLYCRLLESTVRNLSGEQSEEEIEVNLQLRGAAYMPEEYVQDDKVVLEVYRRLDGIESDGDIDALKAEMVERFGPLPAPAARMFEEAKLRRLARLARVPYIWLDPAEGRLIFKLHAWDVKQAERALRGLPESNGVRTPDEKTLSFGLTLKSKHDESALREMVRRLLEPLAYAFRRTQVQNPAREKAASVTT